MGIVHSLICSLTFCCERVLTWFCCACLLITVMFAIVAMVFYGISVGYHFAHNELASWSRGNESLTQLPESHQRYIDDKNDFQNVIPNLYGEPRKADKMDEKQIQQLIAEEVELQQAKKKTEMNVVTRTPLVWTETPEENPILHVLQPNRKTTKVPTVKVERLTSKLTKTAEETEDIKFLEVIPLRTTPVQNIIKQLENEMALDNSSREI